MLNASLTIEGTAIANLNAFRNIIEIGGDLIIQSNNELQNLKGMESLAKIGGGLEVSKNNNMISLEGILKQESINGISKSQNAIN